MIDLTDAGTKPGAERQVVWQEHKQTVENCCKLCDNKAKLKLIEMLPESMERKAPKEAERKASEEAEHKSSSASKASSDGETIIPDNTQA